jgi:hypothetical protein
MPLVIPYWIDRSVPVAVYGFALYAGSKPERIITGACLASWVYANVIHQYLYGQNPQYELFHDILMFLLMTAAALRYDRWWLLFAGSLSLLHIATDFAGRILPVYPWTYATAHWTWNWLFVASLGIGTWANRRHTPMAAKLFR